MFGKFKLILLAFLFAATCKGQGNLTHQNIDSLVLKINNSILNNVLIDSNYKTHTEKEEYFFDSDEKLVKIVIQKSNYHGRVNGHLNNINIYYFIDTTLILVESITKDFDRTINSAKYYTNDLNENKLTKNKKRSVSYFNSQALLYKSKSKKIEQN